MMTVGIPPRRWESLAAYMCHVAEKRKLQAQGTERPRLRVTLYRLQYRNVYRARGSAYGQTGPWKPSVANPKGGFFTDSGKAQAALKDVEDSTAVRAGVREYRIHTL